MLYEVAANLTAVVHLAFIAFVIFGTVLGRRRRTWKYLHIGAMAYGVAIEIFYWACPLTYLEQYLRRQAGHGIYDEPFIAHYANKVMYVEVPQGLLIALAAAVLLINGSLYFRWARRRPVAAIS
jgi:hypothetical protein